MSTWYVDSAADAGGDGTTTATTGANCAFNTVAAAQAAITGDQHGNSLLFKKGCTWREQFSLNVYGTVAGQFTVGAYGTGDLPKFLGSTAVATWSDETGNVWSAACAADPVSVWFVLSDGSIIWGTEVANKAACAAEYDWAWVDADDKLYVYAASDPDARYSSVEKPTRAYGVYAASKAYITIQYVETAFCFASGDGRGIMVANAAGVIVENCVSHHHGDLGDGSDPQGNGIYGYNIPGGIIRNNTLYENGRRGSVVFADATGSSDGVIVEHNESYNNYHAQLDFFVGGGGTNTMAGAIIRYNLCYLNSDYGAQGKGPLNAHGIYLQTDGSTNWLASPEVYYNVVHHMYLDSLIALTARVSDAEVYNNTVYGAFTGSTWSPGIDLRAATVTATVKNNIGVDCVAGCLRVVEDDSITACDNNLWYQSGGGVAIYVDAEAGDYHYDDFAAYKAATDWDTNGFWESPDFTNAATNDFTLTAGSPCVDQGADVSLTEDYAGTSVPVGAAPDIGAYEYVPSSSNHAIKRYTGAAWIKGKLMVYNGAAWEARPVKRWDGAEWVEIDALGS